MKKILLAILLVALAFACVSCNETDPAAKSAGVMTYAQYMAANDGDTVVIEAYVQATQSWWDNKITVYAADPDGAYFLYELACSEDDAAKLVPGTKIKVTGKKTTYKGEVEIYDSTNPATFEFAGDVTYIAEPKDVTDKLGTDNLINYQNQLVTFKGLEVVSVVYKIGVRGDDIYLTVKDDKANEYDFCVERYLTDPDTDVYKAVEALQAGDIVDVTGFAYWYDGINTHVTAVSKVVAE